MAISFFDTIKWFMPLWRRKKKEMVAIFIISLLVIAGETFAPLYLKTIVDNMNASVDLDTKLWPIVGFGLFSLTKLFFSFLLPFARGVMNMVFAAIIRQDYFHIYTQSSREFFMHFSTGDVLTRLTDDVDGNWDRIAWYSCSGIMRPFEAIFTLLFVLSVMLAHSPALTVVAFLPIPFLVAILAHFEHKMLVYTLEKQQAASRCNELLETSFSGIRVIKSTLSELDQVLHYQKLTEDRIVKEKRFLRLNQLVQLAAVFTNNVGVIIAIFFGSYLMKQGSLTLGAFLMFIIYLSNLSGPFWTLSWFYASSRQATKYIERLEETAKYPEPPTLKTDIDKFSELSFSNVEFYYPDDPKKRAVFAPLSFSLKAGEKVAIMGEVGSGKSTVLNLAYGILTAQTGSVYLNGVSIQDYKREALAKIIGRIEQESILFSDSIRENLLLGSEFDEDHLQKAIEQAMIKNEIEQMPQGLQTELSEGGTSLSGGQKQRLSIARTLLRSPELILMDDITAAMDAKTEEKFWQQVKKHHPKSAMLIVTHRQATANIADRIIHL